MDKSEAEAALACEGGRSRDGEDQSRGQEDVTGLSRRLIRARQNGEKVETVIRLERSIEGGVRGGRRGVRIEKSPLFGLKFPRSQLSKSPPRKKETEKKMNAAVAADSGFAER